MSLEGFAHSRFKDLMIYPVAIALTSAVLCLAGLAHAQAWPDRPIKLIVAFTPGGVHDTLTRLLQPHLAQALGQPILIENRGGAGGNIAAEAVAKSPADGYTFLVASEAMATNPYLYQKLGYDAQKDLVPVAKLADFPTALVAHPNLAAQDLRSLIALARNQSNQMSYGSAGIGTSGHLTGEAFKSVTGIEMLHVPYKGGAPATADLIAGRIDVMFLSITLAAPQVRQGKLKPIAIIGTRRVDQLPRVPTTAESGFPEIDSLLLSGVHAPAQTPSAVIARMSAELGRALRVPEMEKRLPEIGAVATPSTPEEFGRILSALRSRWSKLIRDKNIRAD
jgi:tripartite-type tricarboxylate transporter receptor subunit TctC